MDYSFKLSRTSRTIERFQLKSQRQAKGRNNKIRTKSTSCFAELAV